MSTFLEERMDEIWRTKEKNECPYYSGFGKCAIVGVKRCYYDSNNAENWYCCGEIDRMEKNAMEEK